MTDTPPRATTPPTETLAAPDDDVARCDTGPRTGGPHRLDLAGMCVDCGAVAPAALTQFGIPGCTAENPNRELGCNLADSHPLPHRDADGTDFTTPGDAVTDPAVVAAPYPELPADLTLGLTTYGEWLSAQLRLETTLATDDNGDLMYDNGELVLGPTVSSLYLAIKLEAPRSDEDGLPWRFGADDARRLRDLLNIATARGVL